MTYQIKENAKNVWIRDNENTQDLSPLTDANSVYFNSGRTLEQELGKGVMESNIVTVNSSMEKVIDEAYDGVYESGVMYGRSLVNLVGLDDIDVTGSGQNSIVIDENSVTMTSKVEGSAVLLLNIMQKMKANTKYLLKCKHSKNKSVGISFGCQWSGADYRHLITNMNDDFMGVFTTGDELPLRLYIGYLGSSDAGTTVTCSDIQIIEYQEGMENWDIPYFEGLCDVKMPILRNVGKNLCPPLIVGSTINNNNGQIITDDTTINRARTDYIKINPKKNYIISGINNTDKTLVGFYDENKNYLSRTSGTSHSRISLTPDTSVSSPVYTIPQNASYIILSYYGDNLSVFDKANAPIQIEETLGVNADNVTTHEDHKTNILHTPEEIVLREVNGVQDTYNAITGEYVQRISERDYIEGDFTDVNVKTDGVKTQYELTEPVTTIVEPSTIPFIYQNGHIILESGYKGQSLTPILEYTASVSRTGQVENVAKTIRRHETQLTLLEKMLIGNIIELDYNNTLMALNLKMDEVK